MSRTHLRTLACALVALAALLPNATLAMAPSPTAEKPGGAYSVLLDGSVSAISLVRWASSTSGHARLTLKASGLTPGKRYRLVGSEAPCGQPSPSSKRVFSRWLTAGAHGAAWLSAVKVGLLGDRWRDIRSTRLMEEEGIFYYCRSTTSFVSTTLDDQADAAIAVLDAGNRHGIIILDNDGETEAARVRWDLQVGSDKHPKLTAHTTSCSQPATTQGILIALLLPLRGNGQTFGKRQDIEVENDETHWVGHDRSVRVRDAGSPAWGCAKPRLVRTESVNNNET